MNDSAGTWTVRRLLEWTSGFFSRKQVDSPRLSAELLLAHVLGVPRIRLYTDYERPVSEAHLSAYRELVRRAGEHEPIAYLTGRAHFFGLELIVTPDVLIPRPDTETLVENLLQWVRHEPELTAPRVLDLCTGSGCIAVAVASRLKTASVLATDISPKACAVARQNVEKHALQDRVIVEEGDLFEPLKSIVHAQPFHLITANPPYIPHANIETLDRNVRDYEPHLALDGGDDGLAVIRRILETAPRHLTPAGQLFMEMQFDQGDAIRQLVGQIDDWAPPKIIKDLAGKERVVQLQRKP
jgi:release factor glutamine methyltransferase